MQQGVITFLDILGWKGIWQRSSQPDPIESLKKLIQLANEFVDVLRDSLQKNIGSNQVTFEVISISDTIVLLSYPFSIEHVDFEKRSAFSVVDHVMLCRLLIRQSILLGIPIRGAIGIGQFSHADNILVGPAVDEVASWHEVSDWIGVIMAPSINMHPEAAKLFGLVKNYNVPTKSKPFKTGAVDWKGTWLSPHESYQKNFKVALDWEGKSREQLLQEFHKMGPILPEIHSKFSNTLEFFDNAVLEKAGASTEKSTKPIENNLARPAKADIEKVKKPNASKGTSPAKKQTN